MNDDFLTRFRKPPRPEFAASLYQRISKPMPVQPKYPALRFVALSLSVLVVLSLAVLVIPSARTFAQSVLEQVGGYAFTLGEPQPLDASRVPGPISIVRTADSVSVQITGSNVSTAKDPAEAGNLAGFSVLVPAYLPVEYGTLSDWYIITEGNGTVVTRDYHDTAKNILFINQWKVGAGDLKTYTRAQIVDVTVRGRSGVWLPDTPSPDDANALVWEENGITYSLISDSLPLDEMLKVAESLGQ
jgi:hypothetical protein